MRLYEINEAIESFEPDIDPTTGEILNADEFDALTMAREKKIEGVVCRIKNLQAQSDALSNEAAELERRARVANNEIENLKKFLDFALNGEKFETSKCKVTYRKSASVQIDDEVALGDYANTFAPDLIDIVTTVKPNKKKIKEAIKQGVDVAGCRIVEKQNIQIS